MHCGHNLKSYHRDLLICFLDAIASPSTYPGRSVSQSVMFSDFGDSYRIYRDCELVLEYFVRYCWQDSAIKEHPDLFLFPCDHLTHLDHLDPHHRLEHPDLVLLPAEAVPGLLLNFQGKASVSTKVKVGNLR